MLTGATLPPLWFSEPAPQSSHSQQALWCLYKALCQPAGNRNQRSCLKHKGIEYQIENIARPREGWRGSGPLPRPPGMSADTTELTTSGAAASGPARKVESQGLSAFSPGIRSQGHKALAADCLGLQQGGRFDAETAQPVSPRLPTLLIHRHGLQMTGSWPHFRIQSSA